MKKALLFGLILCGAASAFAGEVQQDESALQPQTIPTPTGSYLDFTKAYCYYAGTDGSTVVGGTSLGNMRNGTYVVLQLNNTEPNNGYVLDFQAGNKNDGGILKVDLYNANPIGNEEAEPFFSQQVTIQAMGNWNDMLPYSVTIPQEFPMGNVYMKLTASRSNSVAFSGNFDQFTMTAIENQLTYYTLTTTVSPAEAGTILGNDAESYAEGTVVSLTAKANTGYRFLRWEIGTSESSENPLALTITENTEVEAIFEEIPNALQSDLTFNIADYYSTSGSINIDATGDTPVIGSVKNGASVIYMFKVSATANYSVVAHWTNKYDATITMNVSTDPAEFSDETAVSVDMTSTGGWDNFVEAKWNSFDLQANTVYYLRMSFATTAGWAGNTNYLALENNGSSLLDSMTVDSDASIRYYNLQGIEVDPQQAHGLLLLSNGQKIYKK